MDAIDRKILNELKVVARNPKIKNKDIMEWSTSEETVRKNLREDEDYYNLKSLGVHVAVKKQTKQKG